MTVLLVFLGGAAGAPSRYVLDRLVRRRARGAFPWGTLTVNLIGSLILGALLGASTPHPAAALIGTGFCGGLTTFSTFGYETVRLLENGSPRQALGNAAAGLALGLAAATAGYTAASLLL